MADTSVASVNGAPDGAPVFRNGEGPEAAGPGPSCLQPDLIQATAVFWAGAVRSPCLSSQSVAGHLFQVPAATTETSPTYGALDVRPSALCRTPILPPSSSRPMSANNDLVEIVTVPIGMVSLRRLRQPDRPRRPTLQASSRSPLNASSTWISSMTRSGT